MSPPDGTAPPDGLLDTDRAAGERTLVVSRVFDAAPELLFRAWTDPAQLARWWGPGGFTNPVCEADPRPGGALRIVMRAPNGAEHPMRGVFSQIEPPRRLVFHWEALDARGAPLLAGRTTVTFRPLGPRTELTVATSGAALVTDAAKMLDGMEAGWTQSLERLAAQVAGRPAETAGAVMKLDHFEVLNPRKACAVARHLDAPVQFVRVDPKRGEHRSGAFRAMNPNAKVPVLVDGDRVIWESGAIMCHLAERAGSALWPRDARQVDVVRWMLWDAVHFSQQTGTLYFENIIKAWVGADAPDAAAVAAATEAFRRLARVLDDHLADRDYLVGDTLTLADFSVAAGLPYAEAARIPLAEFPAVARWHARLEALPAWRDPFPAVAEAMA